MIDYEVGKNNTTHNLQCLHGKTSPRTCVVERSNVAWWNGKIMCHPYFEWSIVSHLFGGMLQPCFKRKLCDKCDKMRKKDNIEPKCVISMLVFPRFAIP
jgi:hypothetical protein